MNPSPGVIVVPAPIPTLPPAPALPADYYNQQAWSEWVVAASAYAEAVELHRQIITFLGKISQWAENVPLYQALGLSVPPQPTPPDGYPAPTILPAPAPAPLSSPIGAISSDGPNIYFGHGDNAPVGTPYNDPATGERFVKVVHNNTIFGVQDRWLKIS